MTEYLLDEGGSVVADRGGIIFNYYWGYDLYNTVTR
jgi:hypothetical protein